MTPGAETSTQLTTARAPYVRVSIDRPPGLPLTSLADDLLGVQQMLTAVHRFVHARLLRDDSDQYWIDGKRTDVRDTYEAIQRVRQGWSPSRTEVVRLRYGSPWVVILDVGLTGLAAAALRDMTNRLTQMVLAC